MAVYEIQGSGTDTGSRIRVEVYGRYINNGTSIVAGSMGENGVTELAFYGVPEMDEGQVVTLKWQADGENGPVTGGELMAEDEETGDWTCWIGRKMSRYAHVRAYLQVNAGETVWRSYEFGILHAHLPEEGEEAEDEDEALAEQALSRLSEVQAEMAEMREEIAEMAASIARMAEAAGDEEAGEEGSGI